MIRPLPHFALLFVCSCTTLGPMPATTGISAVPVDRPGLELQVGFVPGFYLSQSAQDAAKGAPIAQIAPLLELDRVIRLPGLIFGARVFGPDGDGMLEPYLGYRHRLGDRLAVLGGVYGTAKRAEKNLASYHGTRIGGEGAIDAKLWAPAAWFALHGQAALSLTRVFASGTYCVDPQGVAKECDTDPAKNTMVSGEQTGYYPSAVGTIALDFGRDVNRRFGGVRLALMAGGGAMPLLRDGVKIDTGAYVIVGATLTLTLGLADKESDSLPE